MPETKTAVEWLFGETLGLTLQLENKRISHRNWVKLFEQAKEMENEQTIAFADKYDAYVVRGGTLTAEQYYNETYGKNN